MPIGKDGKRYAPSVSVCVADSTPVAWFVATTLALGTTAPVASVIVPFSDAVDCASAAGVKRVKSMTNNRKKEKSLRACIDPFKSTAIIMFLQVEILSQALIKFCEPILGVDLGPNHREAARFPGDCSQLIGAAMPLSCFRNLNARIVLSTLSTEKQAFQ